MSDLGTAIIAALAKRRDSLAQGPRTLSELARVCGYAQSTLHQACSGVRPFPAKLEAAIKAALPELA